MKRLGVFVGEQGNATFFSEIGARLRPGFEMTTFQPRTYSTPLLYGRLNRWAFRGGIRRLLQRSDVAFFEWASELLEPASHMPRYCPVVTRLHSYELYAWAPRIDWSRVDRIILVSEAMRRKFCALYPDHAGKTMVVYNGCAVERFTPPPRREFGFNVGMLCTLHPRKRVYDMVLALADLKRLGWRLHLHVAGGVQHGPDLDEYAVALRRLVEKLGLGEDVTLHDHVPDPSDWLRQIDIFVSNSYWEGQQVGLIEAMASGCYCLSHFWDGAEEVVPAGNLFATDLDLREKLVEYCALPEGEKHDRRACMRRLAAVRFDIATTADRIHSVLADAARA